MNKKWVVMLVAVGMAGRVWAAKGVADGLLCFLEGEGQTKK